MHIFLALIRALFQDRSELVIEILALRQQLAILQRSVKRLWAANYYFSPENGHLTSLAPYGVLPCAFPRAAGTLSWAIRTPDGRVVSNSPCTPSHSTLDGVPSLVFLFPMAVSSLCLGTQPRTVVSLKEGYTAFLFFHTF